MSARLYVVREARGAPSSDLPVGQETRTGNATFHRRWPDNGCSRSVDDVRILGRAYDVIIACRSSRGRWNSRQVRRSRDVTGWRWDRGGTGDDDDQEDDEKETKKFAKVGNERSWRTTAGDGSSRQRFFSFCFGHLKWIFVLFPYTAQFVAAATAERSASVSSILTRYKFVCLFVCLRRV